MRPDQLQRLAEIGDRAGGEIRREAQRVVQAAGRKAEEGRTERYAAAEAVGDDVVVAVIPKGSDEIRVAVRTWEGGKTIDMRVYAHNTEGELRATRKALQVDVKHLPALVAALQLASTHV